jgi:hypothetical protein
MSLLQGRRHGTPSQPSGPEIGSPQGFGFAGFQFSLENSCTLYPISVSSYDIKSAATITRRAKFVRTLLAVAGSLLLVDALVLMCLGHFNVGWCCRWLGRCGLVAELEMAGRAALA